MYNENGCISWGSRKARFHCNNLKRYLKIKNFESEDAIPYLEETFYFRCERLK